MKINISPEQIQRLVQLGLNEIQATLYLTSLQHGILSVLELSKITGINRQQIYQESEKLLTLGLYGMTNKNKRKYLAAHPSKLEKVAKDRIHEAEKAAFNIIDLIPDLDMGPTLKKNKVTIKYYEGLKKIKQAYDDELEASKNTEVISFAGSIDNTFKFIPESYWDTWSKKFIKHNSKSRMLVHFSNSARETAQKDKDYKRETKYIDHFPLEANIDIFNNTILIVSFKEEIAVWIDSPILAQSYRIMFDTLWKQGKSF